jgi:hypothetical protein
MPAPAALIEAAPDRNRIAVHDPKTHFRGAPTPTAARELPCVNNGTAARPNPRAADHTTS